MSHLASNHKILIFALLIAFPSCDRLASCGKADKTARRRSDGVPRPSHRRLRLAAALLAAAQSGDRSALLAIFGPDGEEILFTGDAAQDKNRLRDFVDAYTRMNRWEKIKAGGQTLYIGADNYAFPVPLGQDSSGRWYFDTAAGKDEILARRIGKGELTAIAACEATATRKSNISARLTMAARSGSTRRSSSVTRASRTGCTGLSRTARPRARSASLAISRKLWLHHRRSASAIQRLLLSDPRQTGGFAVLAYPSEYRNSGIMTFIVGKDGVVYQKDLGEKTGDSLGHDGIQPSRRLESGHAATGSRRTSSVVTHIGGRPSIQY